MALTDHDTLTGVRELRAAGIGDDAPTDDARGGVGNPRLVAGVEINSVAGDASLWEGELHILGFGLAEDDAAFEATLERQRAGRQVRIAEMLVRLRQLGLPVDDEFASVVADLEPTSIGRPHVARALIQAGLASSIDDAFERLLGRDRPAYVPRQGLGPREAIDAIRRAGGLPVLAHFREAVERVELVDRLIGWGLGGLEVFYGGHGRPFTPDQVSALASFAASRGIVATGGSDYHGAEMAYAEATADLRVPDAIETPFLEALAEARAGR